MRRLPSYRLVAANATHPKNRPDSLAGSGPTRLAGEFGHDPTPITPATLHLGSPMKDGRGAIGQGGLDMRPPIPPAFARCLAGSQASGGKPLGDS